MFQIHENYRIIHQFPQLNLNEYVFVAEDDQDNITFVYVEKDLGAIVQCTDFKQSDIWPLSALNYQDFRDQHNKIMSEIKKMSEPNSTSGSATFCNLDLSSVFMDRVTKRIIIPDFISLQMAKSMYKDLFIYNFERELIEYGNSNQNYQSREHPYLEVNQFMKRIRSKSLNCNDVVPQIIHDLFQSLINAAMDDPVMITVMKDEQKIKEIESDSQADAYDQMKEYYTNYVANKLLIPIADVNIVLDFVKEHLKPEGELITQSCMEIKEYHKKNQSGLRVTATQMFELCNYKTIQKSTTPTGPAIEYGQEYEKIALAQYQKQYPNYRLKQTDVLYSLVYPFICGIPDSIMYDENDNPIGVVEAKCPYSNQNTDLSTRFTEVYYILVDDQQNYHLKKNHSYYYQIQTYLLITGLEWCDLVIYTHKGIRVLRQVRDENCIQQIIKESRDYFLKSIVASKLEKKKINDADVDEICKQLYE